MLDALHNARQIGECVFLKIKLAQIIDALQHLIAALHDRAFEASRETHPSPEAGKYFRGKFEDAIRLFWAHVDRPDDADLSSIRRVIYDQTADFADELFKLLPCISRSSMATANSGVPIDWKMQLNQVSDLAVQLAQLLQLQLELLKMELATKVELYVQIDEACQRLLKVF